MDPPWQSGQSSALQAPDIDVGEAPPDASLSTSGADTSIPSVLKKLHKWGEYEAMGSPLAGTKFIPMKTPLSVDIISNWSLPDPPKYRLTISDLLATQSAAGRKVGMILDLSNHECLYSDDIPADLAYRHVYLVAKELPSPSYVREVREVAQEFWASHPEEYIGIHCAYGFNRTGFVVCSYLVEGACGFSVDQALAAFAASRPPGIRHDYFRAELYRRYGSTPAPSLPADGAVTNGNTEHWLGTSTAAATQPPSSTAAARRVQVTTASTVATACTITTTAASQVGPVPVPSRAQPSEQPLLSPRLSPFSPLSQRPLSASMLDDLGGGGGGQQSVPANGDDDMSGDAGAAAPLTPALSENESLGISDRIIMQSFRAHKAVVQAMTPDDIDSLMAAAARMRQQHTPDRRLQRKSLGAVSWQAAEGGHSICLAMASATTGTPQSSRQPQSSSQQHLEKQILGLKLT